ncbi:DUF2946 family protein [Brachymonas denitrificans]|uniref:DUF2946 family protein n=1 Tax=Brachymonas denitrificans TaxID=28220 RepID=UPI001BCB6D1D|nr:DUF2946 family protein [Brachymonas denitrificans]
MDDLVKQAMAKWPNVPHAYGWLGLGMRGDWYLRDAAAQAAGPFSGPGSSAASRGSVVQLDKLLEFIGRNYLADEQGRWYFQNGPQRVFVELESAPWVLRVQQEASGAYAVRTHTGEPVQVGRALCDEHGHVYLATDRGLGLVHTLDTLVMAQAVEDVVWPLEDVQADSLPERFGYRPSPQQDQAAAG